MRTKLLTSLTSKVMIGVAATALAGGTAGAVVALQPISHDRAETHLVAPASFHAADVTTTTSTTTSTTVAPTTTTTAAPKTAVKKDDGVNEADGANEGNEIDGVNEANDHDDGENDHEDHAAGASAAKPGDKGEVSNANTEDGHKDSGRGANHGGSGRS